jgi:hypothetical protein
MKRRRPKKQREPKAQGGPFHTDTSLGATRLAWRPEDAGDRFAVTHSGKTEPVPVPQLSQPKPPQYEEMLSRIAVLERLIAELPKQRPGIGHNRPPIGEEEVQEITQAVAILKAQPVAPDKAEAAGSTLRKIGERLGTYLDAFLLEAAKSAGKEFGKRLMQLSYWLALATTLMSVAQSVAAWLR